MSTCTSVLTKRKQREPIRELRTWVSVIYSLRGRQLHSYKTYWTKFVPLRLFFNSLKYNYFVRKTKQRVQFSQLINWSIKNTNNSQLNFRSCSLWPHFWHLLIELLESATFDSNQIRMSANLWTQQPILRFINSLSLRTF